MNIAHFQKSILKFFVYPTFLRPLKSGGADDFYHSYPEP